MLGHAEFAPRLYSDTKPRFVIQRIPWHCLIVTREFCLAANKLESARLDKPSTFAFVLVLNAHSPASCGQCLGGRDIVARMSVAVRARVGGNMGTPQLRQAL